MKGGSESFVLVELLIALALLALILASLQGVLSSTVDARTDAERALREAQIREGLASVFRSDFLGVCIRKTGKESFDMGSSAEELSELSFVTSVPPSQYQFGAQWLPLTRIKYFLEPTEEYSDYYILFREETPFSLSESEGSRQPVYEYVASFNVSAYGEEGEKDDWSEDKPPRAVRIRVTLSVDDPAEVRDPRSVTLNFLFPIATGSSEPFKPDLLIRSLEREIPANK